MALPIALIGLRCVGKSSVGRELARLAGAAFVDLDEQILDEWRRREQAEVGAAASESLAAAGVGDVLSSLGLTRFRAFELSAMEGLFERAGGQLIVLATGGGCVETPAARDLLGRAAWCVWLREDLARLGERMQRDPASRPALTSLDPAAEFEQLARRREPLYGALARLPIDCGGQGVEALALRILRELPKPWPDGNWADP